VEIKAFAIYDNKLNRLICARVCKMSARFGTSMSA